MTVTTIPLTGQAVLGSGVAAAGAQVTIKPARSILAEDGTVLVTADRIMITCDEAGLIPDGSMIVPSDADATETVPYFVQELFGDYRSGYVSPLTADESFNLFAADYDGYIAPGLPTELATQAALEQERSDRETADDTISDALAQAVEDLEAADSTNAGAVVAERNRAVSTEANLQSQISALPTTSDVTALFDALIDGSPGTLDTLKEIADALGDDPNFAATITGLIAAKASPADIATAINALSLGTASQHDASFFATATAFTALVSSLSTVATTGAYSDLTGKPTLGSIASHAAGEFQPILTFGLLTAMPATGTASKAIYVATDAGTYADLTNGGAYTKIADLPGQGGIRLGTVTIATLVNITSTTIAVLPSPGPASSTVTVPAGTQAVLAKVKIPNVGATTAGTTVTIELFVDTVAVAGVVRTIAATSDVFDGSFEYEHTPAAGSHTYEIRASVTGNTGKLNTFPAGPSVVLTVSTLKTS